MSNDQLERAPEHQLQVMDVYIVDVLAHIEALLRHTHSMQRVLLQLRSEAPPPRRSTPPRVITALRGHASELQRESGLLQQIVQDLLAGADALESADQ
jgi:hypothetical protein